MKVIKLIGYIALLTLFFVGGVFYGQRVDKSTVPATVSTFKTLACKGCEAIRVTQSVWNGPLLLAESPVIWEVEPKVGNIIEDPAKQWKLTITSVTADEVTLSVTGALYKDLVKTEKVTLKKWQTLSLDAGNSGGGTNWDFYYYRTDNE